jgi:hypothetical protein
VRAIENDLAQRAFLRHEIGHFVRAKHQTVGEKNEQFASGLSRLKRTMFSAIVCSTARCARQKRATL